MRISKDAEVRKNEILDAAGTLFSQKGYEKTTISDIIETVGVARGTVYYHFKSKEEIMDALLERYNQILLERAREAASDKTLSPLPRLFQTLMEMHRMDASEIHEDIHKPQNALMHQKMEHSMLKGIPPILTALIEDGIKEGVFDTPYPYETMEMVIAHVNTVFDSNYFDELPQEQQLRRIRAFIKNMERLFGSAPGSFDPIIGMFDMDESRLYADKSEA